MVRHTYRYLFLSILPFGAAVTLCLSAPAAPPQVSSHPRGGSLASVPVTVVHLSREAQQSIKVETEPVRKQVLNCSVSTTGEVLANASLLRHVNAPVTGRVISVGAAVGDHVAEGHLLVVVRSNDIEQLQSDLLQNQSQVNADLKRDLLQIDAELNQAQSQIKLSESTFNRVKGLLDEKIVSQAEFEAARTELEKNRNSIEALNSKRAATIALSGERLKLLTDPIKHKLKILGLPEATIEKVLHKREVDPHVPVLSPEAGVVIERMINVGELIDPSKALFTIGDFRSVWVKADIYEKDIAKVRLGQPIELEVDSFPGLKFHGKLNHVADSVNPETRTLSVRADVANPGQKLKLNMFARMNILVGEHSVLSIHKNAVQDAGSRKVVYVPAGLNEFEERQVRLGGESGPYVEVLSGLKPGELVVTNGSFELRSVSLRESD
jgi:membrane fusion protein, heavy metal efflux system